MWYFVTVILLTLLLDHVLTDRSAADPLAWFSVWAESVEQRFNGGESRQGTISLLMTAGSVFAVVLLMQGLLGQINGLLRLGFDVLVLLFIIRLSAPMQAADGIAAALAGGDEATAQSLMDAVDPESPSMPGQADTALSATVRLVQGAGHWLFAPVFWFLLIGPAGAVLVHVARVLTHQWDCQRESTREFGRAANVLYQGLAWLPTRLLAISYGLMGNYDGAVQAWRLQRDTWSGSGDELLRNVGLGALDFPVQVEDADVEQPAADPELVVQSAALIWRVAALWLAMGVVVALLQLLHR